MPRPGFGRVEVAAVLLAGGVLTGLLVPAVQKVRAAALRSRCQCRHCQLGLALQTYADGHDGRFPPGTVPQPMPADERLSWVVELLPYLDQDAVSKQLDRTAGHADPANARATGTPLRSFVCPAAPPTTEPVTHSVGVAGVGDDAPALPLGHPRAGVFGTDRQTRMDAEGVPDGLANTLLLVEPVGVPGRWAAGGSGTVRGLDPTRPLAGYHAAPGSNPFARRRTELVALLADGHSRVLTSDIDPAVLAALATVAGGDGVPAD